MRFLFLHFRRWRFKGYYLKQP